MPGLPQRHSLVGQTVAFLDAQIAGGQWRDWLPPERTLCETLQISRSTLRRALEQMRRDGRVRSEHGAGNRILRKAKPRRARLRSHDVALLAPQPLERLRPTQALWIDELRAMLNEHGVRLHVFHGAQYFRAKPGAALEKLLRQNPHGCWVLTLASPGCQQWFARRGTACLVAGSCHTGIDLPFRDLDHRAMCRHAAGVLLAAGHRRLAFLAQKTRLAGDIESEAGFLEGVNQSPRGGASAQVCHHDATANGIALALRRLLAQRPAPTALLVANAYHYLAVVSRLAQLGRLAPRDFSIISRDEDPFLTFLAPEPARYVASPQAFAKSLLRPVMELLEHGAVSQRAARLMPEFIRGETVGPGSE
jgi:DNA-binding LacI/PurR family transcriptional regulator